MGALLNSTTQSLPEFYSYLTFFLRLGKKRSSTLAVTVYGDFVIQLRKDSNPALGQFQGRIEHIDSGFSGSFQNLEELGEVIARLLAKVECTAR
jgi:hypothetical protein